MLMTCTDTANKAMHPNRIKVGAVLMRLGLYLFICFNAGRKHTVKASVMP